MRRKLGQSERESLWKMVGMNSFVWEAFAEFTYIAFVVSNGSIVTRNCFGQIVCPLVSFKTCVSFDPVEGDRGGVP